MTVVESATREKLIDHKRKRSGINQTAAEAWVNAVIQQVKNYHKPHRHENLTDLEITAVILKAVEDKQPFWDGEIQLTSKPKL